MKNLPSFLCIGSQKSGTSWLYQQLRWHPEIWMPPIKELHYFDHVYCPENRSWTTWHIQQSARKILQDYLGQAKTVDFAYVRYIATLAAQPLFTEAWYRRAFHRKAAQGKVLGDITPEYCAIGDDGIAYVKSLLGDVKLMWLIRDPVQRALSQLRMNIERRGLAGQMTDAKWLELAKAPEIVGRGDYVDYIPRWERQFSRDGILFLPFGHIATEPLKVLQAVETYLGVQAWSGYSEMNDKIHATQVFVAPDSVMAYLHEKLQPQYRFLEDYFAADFVRAM